MKPCPPLFHAVRAIRSLPFRLRASVSARGMQYCSDAQITPCYLGSDFPHNPTIKGEALRGGAVKFAALAKEFPHAFPRCSALYRISSVQFHGAREVLDAAKRARIPIITNQNGVYYPAWYSSTWFGGDVHSRNRALADLLHRSDFVIYQSAFCQAASAEFLGEFSGPSCVIFNPVDTASFFPRAESAQTITGSHTQRVILTNWGDGYRRPRTKLAAQSCFELMRSDPTILLRFIGPHASNADADSLRAEISAEAKRYHIEEDRIQFTGEYRRSDAPEVFRAGDLFLHTAQNDPSPNVLGEALASGLPVVYLASGGCPEIVGEAGIGIPIPRSWDRFYYPKPEELSAAIVTVLRNLESYRILARQRAELHLSEGRFIEQHRSVFAGLRHD